MADSMATTLTVYHDILSHRSKASDLIDYQLSIIAR
jgi:hypothetical protein